MLVDAFQLQIIFFLIIILEYKGYGNINDIIC